MGCCTTVLHLSEDNARIILLAVFAVLYMLAGALLFQFLESEVELKMSRDFWSIYYSFRNNSGKLLSGDFEDNNYTLEIYMESVHQLLYAYGNASSAGVINKRRRWDFAGSFHFVGTIVSTIGYGSTAPQTTAGRACVIVYGFFGCSIGILFFNLFLERIITLLAYVLRSIHIRRLRKRIHQQQLEDAKLDSRRASRISRVPSELDEDSSLDSWKPSVYWVMLCLTLASVFVSSCAAAVYAPQENWTFFEALYFCFVSFATIGFGDLVSTQGESYEHVHWYRLGNFIFLVLGCCCIYSLFNVTSIVIKQALNWLIYKLDFRCLDDTSREAGRILRRHSMIIQKQRRMRRRRSSVAVPNKLSRTQLAALFGRKSDVNGTTKRETLTEGESDSPGDSETGRRNSGEMISMKDFLQANKVSLAVMQKELYETAQMTRSGSYGIRRNYYGSSGRDAPPGSFTPGTVGPLAILTQKLELVKYLPPTDLSISTALRIGEQPPIKNKDLSGNADTLITIPFIASVTPDLKVKPDRAGLTDPQKKDQQKS